MQPARKNRVSRLPHFAILTTALALPAAAGAQATGGEGGIETIVVTAQKREQNVQDVPISMEVMQGRDIENLQVNDFRSLMNYVPNLVLQQAPGVPALYIRGFGSSATNYAFDQSVSVYQDGVYGGRARQFQASFFDVERIEVMRGPQGALLGKNTAAGAVSVISAGPTDAFEAAATASYNFSRSGFDAHGYISGPLTDGLSARFALKLTHLDGYIKNPLTGRNDVSPHNNVGRLTLKYEPVSNLDVTLKYEFGDYKTWGFPQVHVAAVGPTHIQAVRYAEEPFGMREVDKQTSHNGALTANWGIGDFTLTAITGISAFRSYQNTSGSGGSPESWLSIFSEKFNQFSQEVRLLSPTGQTFEWIAGAYYDQSSYDFVPVSRYDLFGGAVAGQMHIDFAQRARSWSVFGQGTYHVMDTLRLIGSLRYTETRKNGIYNLQLDYGIPLSPPHAIPRTDINESNLDPSITLQYDVLPGVMTYVSYGRGSKAGGFVSSSRTATPSTFAFGAEKSSNIELGAKATLLEGRLMASVALYRTRFEDLQVSNYDSVLATFVTRNAAAATSKGVEANVDWMVLDNLQISASAAYLDAIYNDFPGASCLWAQPLSVCNPNAPATAPNSQAFNNIGGTVMPFTAKWSGNVRAQHTLPLDDDLKLTTMGVVSFRSASFTGNNLNPYYGRQPSYAKLDLRVEIGDREDRWAVALVGKNVTNQLTETNGYLWPLSSPPTGINILDETRQISLEGRIRF
ncbi:MAG: TonB-dependent receptor [Alphaproteobacteria bacterium]|nr:TonB-dependent receptor [Alphaproteobacteria bacterium]OJU57093.1 MAG: hypothetical protein BGO00_05190 [Alphaproteobacteria bacterium 62-8]